MKRLIIKGLIIKGVAASILLLAAPALGVEQLTEDAPLLTYPTLSFTRDSGWHVGELGLPWRPKPRPAEYVIGTVATEGMAGSEALVIAARRDASWQGSAGAMRTIPIEDGWRGKRVRLSARMKSGGVHSAQLWLYAARPVPLSPRRLSYSVRSLRDGTNDWCHMEFAVRIPEDATSLSYGVSLSGGEGAVWADSFALEVVERSTTRTVADTCRPPRQGGDGWLSPGPNALNSPIGP